MSLADVGALIEADNRRIVMAATWGHLAPERNKTYRGHIVWALGIHGSDYLNPMVLELEMGELPSSPWFYEAMQDFLSEVHREKNGKYWSCSEREAETSGRIYRWDGSFRNYSWCGKVRQLDCKGLKDEEKTSIRPRGGALTKRDFEKIANEIRAIRVKAARLTRAKQLIPSLRASNPKFNEKLFLKACNA
jgi:hypothetical protein